MLTQAVRSVRSISESVRTVSFTIQKASLLNGLVLVATCGIGAASSSPAQAASFNGFGCSDNPSCQTYYEFFNVSARAGIGSSSDTWSLPATRLSSSPVLFSPKHSVIAQILDVGSPFTYSGSSSATLSTDLELGQLRALARASATANIAVDPDYPTTPPQHICLPVLLSKHT
jgi:hypothetical protein